MNFRKLLTELNVAGLSDREVARQVNVSQQAISYLRKKRGGDPRYSLGVKIIELHERVMREKADAA